MKKSKHPNSASIPAKDAPVFVELLPHPPDYSEPEEIDTPPRFIDLIFFVVFACCVVVIFSVFSPVEKWACELWNFFGTH